MIKISPFLSILLCVLLMLFPKAGFAMDNEFITSVDVMKYTKDTVQNQFTDAQIDAMVSLIMKEIQPRYISISVPLDEDADFPADSKPSPRSVQTFAQKWVDSIHKHGAKVIFRGTFSGIEGIYNFPKLVGDKVFPPGTLTSAATDGRSSWLGKIYNFITVHSSLFAAGDIWAVLPERTEGIFQQQTSFLAYGSAGIQTTYANFFADLNQVSKNAFDKIGKNVRMGYTANNFSELASGWIAKSLYSGQSVIAIDHYGITHTPQEMENDLRTVNKKYGKPIFLQEWGDYWNRSLSATDRDAYLNSMYQVFSKLAAEKILIGFNYWGGWANDLEGVLTNNGTLGVNDRGQILAKFFANFSSSTASPLPPLNPVPTPPVAPLPAPPVSATPPPVVPAQIVAAPTVAPPLPPPLPAPVAEPPSPSPIIPGLDILPAIPPTAQASDGEAIVQNQSLRVSRNLAIYLLFGLLLTLFVWWRRMKLKK